MVSLILEREEENPKVLLATSANLLDDLVFAILAFLPDLPMPFPCASFYHSKLFKNLPIVCFAKTL